MLLYMELQRPVQDLNVQLTRHSTGRDCATLLERTAPVADQQAVGEAADDGSSALRGKSCKTSRAQ
jgi:hypothetical protein